MELKPYRSLQASSLSMPCAMWETNLLQTPVTNPQKLRMRLSQVEADPSQKDAESRAAAVRALSSVAQELFPTSKQREICGGRDDAELSKATILERDVIGPLLQAACDYCTDDR